MATTTLTAPGSWAVTDNAGNLVGTVTLAMSAAGKSAGPFATMSAAVAAITSS